MPNDLNKPLLKLNVSDPQRREPGAQRIPPRPERLNRQQQVAKFGPKFDRLAEVLQREQSPIELRNDPNALAPERLLVFEVRGAIQSFISAVRQVHNLEFIDEEELDGDDQDKKPTIYLLVPDALALRQILSLWTLWTHDQPLGYGFKSWDAVFATLRDIRPWGPNDRVKEEDRDIILEEIDGRNDSDRILLEVELVFRSSDASAEEGERNLRAAITAQEGTVVSRSRIKDIGYHAVLVDLPIRAAKIIAERAPTSIAGFEPVMHICPQSVAPSLEAADAEIATKGRQQRSFDRPPILALLDGVPVSQHPLLAGALIVEDLFDLEPLAQVQDRVHGTAMASLIVHGDRNVIGQQLSRPLYVVPVLGAKDEFPNNRLIVDIIYQTILKLRDGRDASAPEVFIVNLSLGNTRKPFQGKMSPWARLVDRLSYRFGILFVVSAGNCSEAFDILDYQTLELYKTAPEDQRAEATIRAVAGLMAERKLLSPAETVNGLTIGAANIDAVSISDRLRSLHANPFPNLSISNPSSALGPGFANSVKPDFLMPGSCEHLRAISSGDRLIVKPSAPGRSCGVKVAAPPLNGRDNYESFTNGTSAAAALASRACHQIYDALEAEHGDAFTSLEHAQRAVLLKALLAHTACWPERTAALIKRVLGPEDNRQNVRQKDNIRRFLGYGIGDPDIAIACAGDRATFWAVGTIPRDHSVTIRVPIPICLSGKSRPHSMQATLAWFTPVKTGHKSYRAVRLSLTEGAEMETALRASSAQSQPDSNQSKRGTILSRRWEGSQSPVIGSNQTIDLRIQREPDNGTPIDEPISFGIAVTLTMPGVVELYDEVKAKLDVRERERTR